MSSIDYSQFAEHRTGAEINELLHHGHPIPVGRGITQSYVTEHYPGWSWNSLMSVWRNAGIVVSTPGGIPACDPEVKAVHFSDDESFVVEWVDEAT